MNDDPVHVSVVGDWTVEAYVNGQFRQNAYLVKHTSGRALAIDPGGRAEDMIGAIESGRLALDAILLTHGHFDHIGGCDALAAHFGQRAVAHEGDKRLVRQASLYALRFCRLAMHPPARLDYFEGTPSFAAAGADWRTISTPGHTRGSVCYLGAGMVFVGDLLFRDSVGPAARPEGDPELLNQSISGLLGALADDVVIFSGHGKPWTIGEARKWWAALSGPPPVYGIFDRAGA